MEDFFDGMFLVEFFGRHFLGGFFWEDFFGRIFLGGFLGGFFLRGILWEEFFVYVDLSRFWFLSRFCLNKEGRRARI